MSLQCWFPWSASPVPLAFGLVLALAAPAPGQPVWLPPSPLAPADAAVPFAARSGPLAGASGPGGGAPVDTSQRSEVVAFYEQHYLPAFAPAIQWTGSVSSCDPGATSAAYADASIGLVNWFRAMAGLPAVARDTGFDDETQAAALMMAAQADVSHAPGTGWACYSAGGRLGAERSNLALGAHGAEAIRLYVEDDGLGNEYVGHRRWILYPPQLTMSSGSNDALVYDPVYGGTYVGANALWVLAPAGVRPAAPEIVAWPPPGFVPYTTVPLRWSFAPNQGRSLVDLSQATVTMATAGGPAVLQALLPQVEGAGDDTIVWEPAGVVRAPGMADTTYTVAVQNAKVNGVTKSYAYDVTIIDPALAPDGDGDGVPDGDDVCPWAADPGQADRGGVGASAGADGVGDACQCGDVSGDGRVTLGDAIAITRAKLVPPTASLVQPALCDVNGDGACSLVDAVVLRRALLVPATAAIVQGCDPAKP